MELGRRGTHTGIGELVVDDQGCRFQAAHLDVQLVARPGARFVECRQGQRGQPACPGGIRPLGPPQGPSAVFAEYADLDRDRDHEAHPDLRRQPPESTDVDQGPQQEPEEVPGEEHRRDADTGGSESPQVDPGGQDHRQQEQRQDAVAPDGQ